MVKYALAAAGLKLFSVSPQTELFYRRLGNNQGKRRRTQRGLPSYYVDRARRLLDWCERYQILRPGDSVLEVGTGWVHWESLIVRIFYDVEITLFDVWDNRQLETLKCFCAQLDDQLDDQVAMSFAQHQRVHDLLRRILVTESFDELYVLLGFHYVVDKTGTLGGFPEEGFAAIYSGSVLQHVKRDILKGYIQDFNRLLKPGGYSMHTVDLNDQIYYYDRNVPQKNYLRFSDNAWHRFFENRVQYFNRVQRPEWLSLFHDAGLELVEEETLGNSLGDMKVDKCYADLARSDQECTLLRIVHRKPKRP